MKYLLLFELLTVKLRKMGIKNRGGLEHSCQSVKRPVEMRIKIKKSNISSLNLFSIYRFANEMRNVHKWKKNSIILLWNSRKKNFQKEKCFKLWHVKPFLFKVFQKKIRRDTMCLQLNQDTLSISFRSIWRKKNTNSLVLNLNSDIIKNLKCLDCL